MQNEDVIFNSIKNSPEINPQEEFINQTRLKLIKEAKRINKRQ
jgi:hypothetical protein